MDETKGERRERRKQNRRKMRVSGKSVILLSRIVQDRAERIAQKRKARGI